jgi:hypothetical protein
MLNIFTFPLQTIKHTPMLQRILLLLAISLLSANCLFSQVTTSVVSGVIKSPSGEDLSGATVTATHEPTGTNYTVSSDKNGRYTIYNMKPGGPYSFTVTFVGYEPEKRVDIHLNLGETPNVDFVMQNKAATLSEVVIASRRVGTTKGGTETNIGRDKIANLPTVGRNLSDYLRFTPQVKITTNGGFSFAGQNNRYNTFLIDGAVNNDVFGLSEQGTNGGRAGAPPISIDAIDQMVVQLSPYDVSLGNFTGAGINAITRAGTNNYQGSVYYVFRNQALTGRNPLETPKPGSPNELERTKLPDFTNKTFGFRVGGPIIKNKLFFFLNLERQDDERPQPFDATTYRGNYIKNDSINVLINHLKTKYGYDPGGYTTNPDLIKANRLASRFDWNINQKHQLTASYRYTELERTNPSRSSVSTINFDNNAEFFPSVTHSGSAELNSRFSPVISNKFRVTYTNVVDDRNTVGSPFPTTTIRDGGTANLINFGGEAASTANLLKQDILNLYEALRWVKGTHSLTAGFDIDVNKTFNLFINRGWGAYEFASIGDFMNGVAPVRYRRGYSLVDPGKAGDESVNAGADFNTMRLGFFVGDDIRMSDNFTLTVGLRADKTSFSDDPRIDPFFRDSAMPVITKYYDLAGAQSGKMYEPSWQFSPRVGFRYNLASENAVIRGGIGLFAGRIPLVWPGGAFQNNGVTIGAIDQRNTVSGVDRPITFPDGRPVPFIADVNSQYTGADFGLSGSRVFPQGEMNIVSKEFKMPQVLRTTLAVDKRIGQGWTFTIEGVYTKNIEEVNWTNVIWDPTTMVSTTGPGARMVFDPRISSANYRLPLRPTLTGNARNPYTSIILVSNNEEDKGYSYNFTVSIDKAFRSGLAFNTSYTYGSSQVLNEATSSVNSSNWNNMEAVNGRNFIGLSTSDFDLGHRITSYISKRFSYAKNKFATTVTLDYVGQSGSPISYTMTGNINGDGNAFNDLMYIPTAAEVQQMVFLVNNGVAPATQQQQFETYIQSDDYLNKNRGRFAERNGSRLPFTNVVNLGIKQDFNIKLGQRAYSFQVSYDVFNFTNMLNKDWGRQYFANFDQVQVLQFASFQTGTTTPQYRFLQPTTPWGKPYNISDGTTLYNNTRWSSQLTFRLNF